MINSWEELEQSCKNCSKCKLESTRNNVVVAEGDKNAKVMLIGEGPGADEDAKGLPFVGRAGRLMNMAFAGIGIKREEVYITNVVKCRPPGNRNPEKDEIEACNNFLETQIRLVKPKIVVILGSVALKTLLGDEYGITNTRGHWIEKDGIMYMPTFHPAALLRDEKKKIAFWKDLKEVKEKKDKLQFA